MERRDDEPIPEGGDEQPFTDEPAEPRGSEEGVAGRDAAEGPRTVPGITAPLDETTDEEERLRRPVGMMPGGEGPAREADLDDGDEAASDRA